MYMGKVVGNVVATTKDESLEGHKMLVVSRLDEHLKSISRTEVSIDTVGAGIGEYVLITGGSSARITSGNNKSSVDSAIVAIIDTVEIEG